MIDQRIVGHEAGHAAAAIFLGRLPRAIRVDNPAGGAAVSGQVEFGLGDGMTRDLASDLLVTVLAGPICEPCRKDPWPPSFDELRPDHPSRDVAQLAILAKYLGLDARAYQGHVAIAYHIADTVPFKETQALLAAALSRVPVITAEQIRTLIGPEAIAKFEIGSE